jgi:hypothetical protein
MSPWPSSSSPPFWSSTIRESIPLATLKQTRQGMLLLIRPVTTLACGRCVARIRWIPTARAFWAMRMIEFSTSLLVIIMSASSSMMKTM